MLSLWNDGTQRLHGSFILAKVSFRTHLVLFSSLVLGCVQGSIYFLLPEGGAFHRVIPPSSAMEEVLPSQQVHVPDQ